MKYRKSFLDEVKRFDECNKCCQKHCPSLTDLGIKQFHEFESHGKTPNEPDPYFTHLLNGKKWWEWTLNYIAATYLTWEWVGWYCYAKDFIDDPAAFRQLRQRLYQDPIDPAQFIKECDSLVVPILAQGEQK